MLYSSCRPSGQGEDIVDGVLYYGDISIFGIDVCWVSFWADVNYLFPEMETLRSLHRDW